jgi:hypothetical protein
MGLVNFIQVNWTDLWIAISSVVTVASVIVKLTPNKWDDALLVKILQVLSLSKGHSDPKMDPK